MIGELGRLLEDAGLRLVRVVDVAEPLVPPGVAGFASSCGSDDSLLVEVLDLGDALLVEKANAAWLRAARHGGLFPDDDRRFCLAADLEEVGAWWVEVELLDEWDIMGVGAASGLLGLARGRPAFTMLSLSGDVVLRTTYGETYLDIVVVSEPHRVDLLRSQAEFMAGWHETDELTRTAIQRWLEVHPVSDGG